MEAEDFSSSTIMTEDGMHIIDHMSNTVMSMPFSLDMEFETMDEEGIDFQNLDAQNMEYVGSGTGEFMGTTRNYEEYRLGDDTTFRYYFDADNLIGMESISDQETFTIEIESMTESVDESMFEIPDDHQVIEIGT